MALAGYTFTQGQDSEGDDIYCGVLNSLTTSDEYIGAGGWPDLARVCSNLADCIAVSLSKNETSGEYQYCAKSSVAGLKASAGTMRQACLGILIQA